MADVAKNKKDEIVDTLNVTPLIATDLPHVTPATSWDELTTGANEVLGAELAKEALFDALEGVPFLIHSLTFRKGVKRSNGVQAAYVSCEARIAPEAELRRRRVNLAEMPFDPDSSIVFNDGSTGIYRQIVSFLAATQVITLPQPIVENGSYGESSFDLPPSEWASVNAGESRFDPDGFMEFRVNLRLKCPRGVRISEYPSDYNPSGSKTRYLA